MNMKRLLGLIYAIYSINLACAADSMIQLSWPQLIPSAATNEFDDPFKTLTSVQLYNLSLVARFRESTVSGEKLPEDYERTYKQAIRLLDEQNVDTDGLLAIRNDIAIKRQEAAEALDLSLNNHRVRIPGYLLPLDMSNDKVTEFLLVPTVGACIHVPPPPANQMVYVQFPKGFEADGLYPPVWVEGLMSVGKGESNLYLSDGADNVTFGYSIAASSVENYTR